MPSRTCAVFVLALDVFAQQGGEDMPIDVQSNMDLTVNALGDIDVTVMLQTLSVQAPVENNLTHLLVQLKDKIQAETSSHGGLKSDVLIPAVFAEYVAMTLLVVIGCGSAMVSAKERGMVLQVAFSFGFAVSSLVYAISHYRGAGQLNCAVTIALFLTYQVSASQAILNIIAQMLGSMTGAFLLTLIIPQESDKTECLGTNKVGENYGRWNALCGEAIMTFLLVFVVLVSTFHPTSASNPVSAYEALGFAVFLGHSLLIPIDGCSLNPTRSFGPALVSKIRYKDCGDPFRDHWVFWVGPLSGAYLAVLASSLLCA